MQTTVQRRSVVLFVVTVLAGPIGAQADGRRAGEEFVVEQRISDRWLADRVGPRFGPVREIRNYTYLTPLPARAAGGKTFSARFEITAETRPITFDIRADGSLGQVDVDFRLIQSPWGEPLASLNDSIAIVQRDFMGERSFGMPASRVWDLFPVVRAPTLEIGTRWVDTLDQSMEHFGFSQSRSGVRVSRVVGDTVVGGTRLWIVRDSLDGTLVERIFEPEASLGAFTTIERRTRGALRGRYLLDPVTRFARVRVDTMELAGEITLRYPDGRVFRSPIRYERRRTLWTHTPATYHDRMVALWNNPELMSDRAPNVPVPVPPIQSRDSAVRRVAVDSVFSAWDRTTDAFEAARLWTVVGPMAMNVGSPYRAEGVRRTRAAGDSLQELAALFLQPATWTPAVLRDLILPAYADPGAALARGLSRDAIYTTLTKALVEAPPAITDSARRLLAPATYEYLATQLRSATESRLRDLSLVARFVIDPKQWADTVLRLTPVSPIANEAVLLARGAGSRWLSEGRHPLPERSAPAEEWRQWIGVPTMRPWQAIPAVLTGTSTASQRQLAVETSHVVAIRMFELRTGRPVTDELRLARASSPDDASTAIYSAILQQLGALEVTGPDVLAALRSGDATRITQARNAVGDLFRVASGKPDTRQPADSATAVAVLDKLIALAIGAGPGWPELAPTIGRGGAPLPGLAQIAPGPGRVNSVFVSDAMPRAVIDRWSRENVTFMTTARWSAAQAAGDQRTPYRLEGPFRSGPFLSVRIIANGQYAGPGGLRAVDSVISSFLLMEVDGVWMAIQVARVAS